MTGPADQPTKPLRTWRPMILWTAAILLALGLVWFAAAVVVPVWMTRTVLQKYSRRYSQLPQEYIDRLGGPERALPKLVFYTRLPSCLAPQKWAALDLLGFCGQRAVPTLVGALRDPDADVRMAAARAFTGSDLATRECVPALVVALNDQGSQVRYWAACALSAIGPEAAASIPALEKALSDQDPSVRTAAAEALKKIRGG